MSNIPPAVAPADSEPAAVKTEEPNLKVRQHFRPEIGAGGFSRHDSLVEFHFRINALVQPDMTVLDVGAGRGAFAFDTLPFRKKLRDMRGKCRRVIGLDVDPVVMTNPTLDEAHIIEPSASWPVADQSIGLIVSDWVLEHIDDPAAFAAEAYRVLRPGGWLCARTPNKWGLVGVAARLIPNQLHTSMLTVLQPTRKAFDVFPVRYRLNTMGALNQFLPNDKWQNCSYADSGDPSYIANSSLIWRATALLYRLLPAAAATNLYVFAQKRP